MTDAWLIVVAVLLLILVPFDWVVAGIFIGIAFVRPRIRLLTLAAVRSVGIAIAATIGGILGAQTILFNLTNGEVRLLPTPLPAILIAVALIVISIPNIYALRVLIVNDEVKG
jgi:hypothetical protein